MLVVGSVDLGMGVLVVVRGAGSTVNDAAGFVVGMILDARDLVVDGVIEQLCNF